MNVKDIILVSDILIILNELKWVDLIVKSC